MNTRKKGFTLIEVMIVLGIVAILVAFAIPSFQDALRKSRRSDAMNTIMDIQLAEEKYRVNHIEYGDNAALLFDSPQQISPKGHYSVEVELDDAEKTTSYTITAEALNDQVNDYCGNFILTNTRGDIEWTTSKGEADLCWRK